MSVRSATEGDCDGILACLHSAFEPYKTEAGEIIGTIACQVRVEGEGHLRGMAVDPRLQGRGISQQLLERAESELHARHCQRITLDTTQYLQRAIHFYECNGYRASGKVTDFFGMPLYEYIK